VSARKSLFFALLAGVASAPLHAQGAAPAATTDAEAEAAQPSVDGEDEEVDESEEIVVTGQRPRGSVVGDIDPEMVLNRRDIRTYGASSVADLLTALAPQTQSGRGRDGGGPVTLLNGKRISGFQEIRDIPPEAIERVEILPEEVALKYGYRADQRVVNIVLRRRFRAVTAEAEGGMPTAGGRLSGELDLDYLRIDDKGRWNLDLEYEHSGALLESERDIVQATAPTDPTLDPGEFRTLLPRTDALGLNGTLNRTIFGDVSATFNAALDASDSESRLGLGSATGTLLTRDSDSRSVHLGAAFNGEIAPWRWTLTGNYDLSKSRSSTDPSTGLSPRDQSRSTSSTGNIDLLFNGPLLTLPAGKANASLRVGAETRDFESETLRAGVAGSADIARDRVNGQANLDLPIARKSRGVLAFAGDLSANLNLAAEHLSDFGTLTTLGYGLNWTPIDPIRVLVSVTHEEGAPSVQQLGDPQVATPGVRVFDFTRGETVDIIRIDGGNPLLSADDRRVMKVGLDVKPWDEKELRFSVNYTDSSIRNVIASFPTATPEIEAVFPDRFVRDGAGQLISIDARPVNFARSDRKELRWGVNFSQPIGKAPPPRERRGGRGAGAGGQAGTPGAPPQGSGQGRGPGGAGPGAGGGRGFAGGRGGFGGGRFGGGGQGRLQLSLYHTWRLEDTILIREGVPELDLLNGSATGSRGGRPRHELQFQSGIFKNGLGARVTANWQSGTEVFGAPPATGGTSGDLNFGSFSTINLRLFADLGARRELARKHPFLRGMRVSLEIDNLFDSRLDVRDASGLTPLGYQPDLLDPLGRAVRISVRKLFF
jgi:iron complex outermembrane receptor protein